MLLIEMTTFVPWREISRGQARPGAMVSLSSVHNNCLSYSLRLPQASFSKLTELLKKEFALLVHFSPMTATALPGQ